jgi:ABC-type transport system involved in multi-copper enzyme maturation permease subunit
MNRKNIIWWMDGDYDFLNLLIGIIILVPFLIVILVISIAGTIIDMSRSSSFNPPTYLQGRMMDGAAISLSEYEISRKILEENRCKRVCQK